MKISQRSSFSHVWIFIVLLLAVGSCTKHTSPFVPEVTTISLKTHVDGQALLPDTVKYRNEAGEWYSVSRLEFYLSNFIFYRGNEVICMDTSVHYLDASPGLLPEFQMPCKLEGWYDRVTFQIGIDSARNVQGAIPNTIENQRMVWPVPMGGGYHFLKLEGHFKSESGDDLYGYAMHIGTNACLVTVSLENVHIQPNATSGAVTLAMNVNSWFRYPTVYSFLTTGNYSMGNMEAMAILAANGSHTLKFE